MMLSPGNMLSKRARMARHAHGELPNVLKARFSPTAVWHSQTDDEETDAPTLPAILGPLAPTRETTTPAALTTRVTTPSTSSPTPTPTPTPARTTTTSAPTVATTSPSNSANSAVAQTTSTISTSSSTSSTRSAITPTTTAPTTTLVTSVETTARVTRTVSSSAISSGTSLGSAASPTSSGTESSGIGTAGVVGIVAAGIVGAVALVAAVMFFMRRRNNRENEYDPDDFRRQSIMLPDDAPLQRGNSYGRGPRPPTMIERHNQNMATFAAIPTTYQSTGNSYGSANPFNDYSAQSSPSFTPGTYVPNSVMSPPPMAHYANAAPYYNPAMQSPVGSPDTVTSYGGAAYDAHGNLVRSPSNAAAPMLSRNNSVLHPDENPDYLTRASVTPFQAAQYAAISKQLNIPPPQPLQQVSEAEETEVNNINQGNPLVARSASMVSPFEDPHANITQNSADAAKSINEEKFEASRPSSEFYPSLEPAPRVPSTPPSLPEIKMMSGTFSPVTSNFPVTPSPRKGSFDVGSGRASPKVDLPQLSPVASSPQRAQFVEGLEARAHDGHETPVEIGFIESTPKADAQPSAETATQAEHKAEVPKTEAAPKVPVTKRPETLYSDDDAYGGF